MANRLLFNQVKNEQAGKRVQKDIEHSIKVHALFQQ